MNIWFFGKTYDLDQMPVEEVENDIEERLKDYTKVDIGVSIMARADGYDICLHRSLNVELHNGCILEADTFLISGEGYCGFMPEYMSIGSFSHFQCFTHFFDLPEFENTCKRNLEYYTGHKVRYVKISEFTNQLTFSATL